LPEKARIRRAFSHSGKSLPGAIEPTHRRSPESLRPTILKLPFLTVCDRKPGAPLRSDLGSRFSPDLRPSMTQSGELTVCDCRPTVALFRNRFSGPDRPKPGVFLLDCRAIYHRQA
jgi:hypothetical protein